MTVTREIGAAPFRFDGGPAAEDLKRWVDEGYTDSQIADIVGREFHTDPPAKQTVAYWRQRHGIRRNRVIAPRLDHSAVRPWKVKAKHTGDGIEHRLYEYSNRLHGRRLSPSADRRLDDFLDWLREHDVVVDYDPDSEQGWLFRRRDPALDRPEDIIRRPS